MEYPLCDQTVTVYRPEGKAVQRQVLHGCYFQWTQRLVWEATGYRQERAFLLVVPGQELRVFPGDRVLPGEGPQVADWDGFVPERVEGLVQVGWVKPCYLEGKLCHTEAGD